MDGILPSEAVESVCIIMSLVHTRVPLTLDNFAVFQEFVFRNVETHTHNLNVRQHQLPSTDSRVQTTHHILIKVCL